MHGTKARLESAAQSSPALQFPALAPQNSKHHHPRCKTAELSFVRARRAKLFPAPCREFAQCCFLVSPRCVCPDRFSSCEQSRCDRIAKVLPPRLPRAGFPFWNFSRPARLHEARLRQNRFPTPTRFVFVSPASNYRNRREFVWPVGRASPRAPDFFAPHSDFQNAAKAVSIPDEPTENKGRFPTANPSINPPMRCKCSTFSASNKITSGFGGENFFECGTGFIFRKHYFRNIEQRDSFLRLLRQMQSQIRLSHRRDWMPADGRMPVEPVDFAVVADAKTRKMISENRESSQRRRGGEHRNERRVENFGRQVNHTTNAADGWRRIERGADFVMNMARAEGF